MSEPFGRIFSQALKASVGFKGGISTTEEMNRNLLHGNSKMSLRILPPFPVLPRASATDLSMFRTWGWDFQTGSPNPGVGFRASLAPFGRSAWGTLGRRLFTLSCCSESLFYLRPFLCCSDSLTTLANPIFSVFYKASFSLSMDPLILQSALKIRNPLCFPWTGRERGK